jgi:hypothetical protein
MTSLKDLWIDSKDFILGKTIQQVIAFCGDGKLKDGSAASIEFRSFIKNIPNSLLAQYADECLEMSFPDSGLVLQDVVNQMGSRIGFDVEYGFYKGRKNQIGYDGIWTAANGYSIVVEVKTTDAYRINLDTLSEYRLNLVSKQKISKNSSILIVVGRKDTGDLEAQIRGSRHAWDIRLISTDAIASLMKVRENLNDAKTIQQINEVLKPQEYTRIDRLIDVIFTTTQDAKTDEPQDEEIEEVNNSQTAMGVKVEKTPKFHPVKFHDACMDRVQAHLKMPFIKKSRSSFSNADNNVSVICSVSKVHKLQSSEKFWFAYHPYYTEFLKEAETAYVVYGCGSPDLTVLIPFEIFEPLIADFWTTENAERMYWHIVIYQKGGKLLLQIPKRNEMKDISEFIIG